MDYEKKIEIPFGAKDSELCECEYTIPQGYEAEIKDGKVIIRKKESEDERIRKQIKAFIKSRGSQITQSKTDAWLAWLEKQGTPAKLSEEEQNRFAKGVLTSCALSFIDYLDAHKYEGKMCVSNGECEDIENAFHNAMWDRLHRYYCKYIEKQGEQKVFIPKFRIGDIVKSKSQPMLDSRIITNIDKDCYRTKGGGCIGFAWEKDYELVEQKPDKIVCNPDTCIYIKNYRDIQQWSEEDEKILQWIITDITNLKNGYKKANAIVNKELDWLKSLRPQSQWRPSEEQIEIIDMVLTNESMDSNVASILRELKEQLKALL